MSHKHFVIILAAGEGKRMKADVLKQFLVLGNKPVLMHSLMTFYEFHQNFMTFDELLMNFDSNHQNFMKFDEQHVQIMKFNEKYTKHPFLNKLIGSFYFF